MAVSPRITLRSSPGLIVNQESRETVLEVGKQKLAVNEESLLATIGEAPPLFKDEKAEKPSAVQAVKTLNYDDESILQAVAPLFAQQVRGSMSSGDLTFLQLEGGSLMRPGSSFPAKLPQLEGQTFDIRIESISAEAYELRLGKARVRLTYDRSEPGSQRIRLSE